LRPHQIGLCEMGELMKRRTLHCSLKALGLPVKLCVIFFVPFYNPSNALFLLLFSDASQIYGCVVDMHNHLRRKTDGGFDMQEYFDHPDLYESVFAKEVLGVDFSTLLALPLIVVLSLFHE